jgi:hypothetical protein
VTACFKHERKDVASVDEIVEAVHISDGAITRYCLRCQILPYQDRSWSANRLCRSPGIRTTSGHTRTHARSRRNRPPAVMITGRPQKCESRVDWMSALLHNGPQETTGTGDVRGEGQPQAATRGRPCEGLGMTAPVTRRRLRRAAASWHTAGISSLRLPTPAISSIAAVPAGGAHGRHRVRQEAVRPMRWCERGRPMTAVQSQAFMRRQSQYLLVSRDCWPFYPSCT